MKTCLDCLNCKLRPKASGNNTKYRSMICTEGQWVDPNGNQVSVLYSPQNIQYARLGNSRYLNQVGGCQFLNDMGEDNA